MSLHYWIGLMHLLAAASFSFSLSAADPGLCPWILLQISHDAGVIWHFSTLVELAILSCTTHPGILHHLKQATHLPCASVSSHLLSWHRSHTCRSSTSSHCTLLLAKPRARPHLFMYRLWSTQTHMTVQAFIQAGLVRRGLMERSQHAATFTHKDLDEAAFSNFKLLHNLRHRLFGDRGAANIKMFQTSYLQLAPTPSMVKNINPKKTWPDQLYPHCSCISTSPERV